jgi:hypothetical protein
MILPHLLLLSHEVSPTVVFNEQQEQHHPYDKRGDTCDWQPVTEACAHLELYAEGDKVAIEDERPVHPAELVCYTEDGKQKEDGKRVFNHITDEIHRLVHDEVMTENADKPEHPEGWDCAYCEAGNPSGT